MKFLITVVVVIHALSNAFSSTPLKFEMMKRITSNVMQCNVKTIHSCPQSSTIFTRFFSSDFDNKKPKTFQKQRDFKSPTNLGLTI
jgi:hypothetical protein